MAMVGGPCNRCGKRARTMIRDMTVHPDKLWCPDCWCEKEGKG
jgi:hypothetical protein